MKIKRDVNKIEGEQIKYVYCNYNNCRARKEFFFTMGINNIRNCYQVTLMSSFNLRLVSLTIKPSIFLRNFMKNAQIRKNDILWISQRIKIHTYYILNHQRL